MLCFRHRRRTCEACFALTVNIIFEIYLGFVCFRPENQRVLQKKQSNTQNHGQGTHSAKMGAVVWLKMPQMPPKIFDSICLPKPKFGIFEKKTLSLDVRSPWFSAFAFFRCLLQLIWKVLKNSWQFSLFDSIRRSLLLFRSECRFLHNQIMKR